MAHPPLEFSAELRHQVATLPNGPGVYQYFDAQGLLLYVGKARQLKKRVSSYFTRSHDGTRIGQMVARIATVQITLVRTEAEALILENNLIKSGKPQYNIVFRDDKSYPYLRLSQDAFARISYSRGRPDKKHHWYGPYPNSWAVKQTIELLQKMFLLRSCEDTVFQNRSRPCLLYQIQRCTGPCVGRISAEDYGKSVADARAFLDGEVDTLMHTLQARMLAYAEQLQFEQAAAVRNQISSLSYVLQQQLVSVQADRDIDMLAVELQADRACVNLAMVRGGRHLGDRSFFPLHTQGASASEVLSAFVTQHYAELPAPPCLVSTCAVDAQVLEALSERQGHAVTLTTQPRAQRRIWLELAQKNARHQLARVLSQECARQLRTQALCAVLGLADTTDIRIECFDVSHHAGEATQASCVVYEHHAMQSKEYRRYNMSGITGGDDCAAMRQALERRYSKMQQALASGQSLRLPDVVLIDGGKGQISAARAVFAQLGLDVRLLVGVEKGEGRKVGLEELVFADGRAKISLPSDAMALLLIAQIRDEAHRFAITGMRAKRASARTGGSRLEDIGGVGTRRRAALVQRFGGVRGVAAASIEELITVAGISHALAEKIYQQFHA